MGIGSKEGLIVSGPIMFIGFIFVGFVNTLFWMEFPLFAGYRKLFVLFCR
jgi:hypothetical protein